jgi:hypothetical protein
MSAMNFIAACASFCFPLTMRYLGDSGKINSNIIDGMMGKDTMMMNHLHPSEFKKKYAVTAVMNIPTLDTNIIKDVPSDRYLTGTT